MSGTVNELEIVSGLIEQRRRLIDARTAFSRGENISQYLLDDEMAELNSKAEIAARNCLEGMIQNVQAALVARGVNL